LPSTAAWSGVNKEGGFIQKQVEIFELLKIKFITKYGYSA
jgi:hypothetical protein